eukprot:PhM_4_TR14404/c0_g1_i1/m.20595
MPMLFNSVDPDLVGGSDFGSLDTPHGVSVSDTNISMPKSIASMGSSGGGKAPTKVSAKMGAGPSPKPDMKQCIEEGMKIITTMQSKGCLNDQQVSGIKKALGF